MSMYAHRHMDLNTRTNWLERGGCGIDWIWMDQTNWETWISKGLHCSQLVLPRVVYVIKLQNNFSIINTAKQGFNDSKISNVTNIFFFQYQIKNRWKHGSNNQNFINWSTCKRDLKTVIITSNITWLNIIVVIVEYIRRYWKYRNTFREKFLYDYQDKKYVYDKRIALFFCPWLWTHTQLNYMFI